MTDAVCRILVLDDRDHTLLLRGRADAAGAVRWVVPGGPADPGEGTPEAAVRQVREQTGLWIGAQQLLGPVATIDGAETVYAVRARRFEADTDEWTETERAELDGIEWVSRDDAALLPEPLPALWSAAESPERWPVPLQTPVPGSAPTHPVPTLAPLDEALTAACVALLPALLRPEHTASPVHALLLDEARRRAGLPLDGPAAAALRQWRSALEEHGLVVAYDPLSPLGWSYAARRPGVDTDLVRAAAGAGR